MSQTGPFAILLNALSPHFELQVSPESFVFSCRDRTEAISPVIYLSGSGKRQRVAAIGNSFAPPGPHTRVDLLDPNSEPLPPLTRIDALEGFIRFGMMKVSRRWLLRPSFNVIGAQSLHGAFDGQERAVLKKALLTAGAHNVVFV
jgi:hypothetical protein